MTAKSRRHKLDKKRKSDEHPQPRHREEDRRRPEGSRGRTGLIPRKREGQAAPDQEQCLKAIVDAFNEGKATLRGISLVPEGQGFPGSSFELVKDEDLDDLVPLNVVDPKDWGIVGVPEDFRLYVNDQEKELIDGAYREWQERQARGKEGVRTAGSSDAATAS